MIVGVNRTLLPPSKLNLFPNSPSKFKTFVPICLSASHVSHKKEGVNRKKCFGGKNPNRQKTHFFDFEFCVCNRQAVQRFKFAFKHRYQS
jgi:hypothetical protein